MNDHRIECHAHAPFTDPSPWIRNHVCRDKHGHTGAHHCFAAGCTHTWNDK